jgi:hypothetical protein
MSAQNLSFYFKIDTILPREDVPPQSFADGSYKPPTQNDHFRNLSTTGWRQFTLDGVSQEKMLSPAAQRAYSTSVFYVGQSASQFLFYPADCRTMNILDVENNYGERRGWQHLCFTEKDASHMVLDLYGEQIGLCGPAGTYSPCLLPLYYQSTENNRPVGLSGHMGLLLALTAFSCGHDRMLDAIRHRLNFRAQRWENGNVMTWGNGRKLQHEASQKQGG